MVSITTNANAIWLDNDEKEELCIPVSSVLVVQRLLKENGSLLSICSYNFEIIANFKNPDDTSQFMFEIYLGKQHNINYNGHYELQDYHISWK